MSIQITSYCHLQRAACVSGKAIQVAYRGECKRKSAIYYEYNSNSKINLTQIIKNIKFLKFTSVSTIRLKESRSLHPLKNTSLHFVTTINFFTNNLLVTSHERC
jgi:hypothetical protein